VAQEGYKSVNKRRLYVYNMFRPHGLFCSLKRESSQLHCVKRPGFALICVHDLNCVLLPEVIYSKWSFLKNCQSAGQEIGSVLWNSSFNTVFTKGLIASSYVRKCLPSILLPIDSPQ
jgi:hypothetical protein